MKFFCAFFYLVSSVGFAFSPAQNSSDNCDAKKCWQNMDKELQKLIAPQVEACKQDLKNKKCDLIPDSDERKLCHPSQFCTSFSQDSADVLKFCGLGLIDPTVSSLKSIGDFIGKIAGAVVLCSTRKNCGYPELSPERDSELAQNMRIYYRNIAEKEKYEEAQLCEANKRGYGCPLPSISCREWDQLLVAGQVPKNISDKDGYNKGLFCKDVLSKLGQERAEAIDSDAKRAAEVVKNWLLSYPQRYPCFQTKYAIIEACKVLGHLGSFVTVPYLISQSAVLLSEGYSVLQASKKLDELVTASQTTVDEAQLSANEKKFRAKARKDADLDKKMKKAGDSLDEILKLDEVRAKKVLNAVDKMTADELKLFREEVKSPKWKWCE